MATGETKLSYLDVVDDIQDGDTVPILRNGKNYMSTGLAQVSADLTDIESGLSGVFTTDGVLPSGGDLNDLVTGGLYYCHSSQAPQENMPANASGWVLVFTRKLATAAIYCRQFYIRLGSAAPNNVQVYTRTDYEGTWTAWYQFSLSAVSTTSVGDPVVMGEEDSTD